MAYAGKPKPNPRPRPKPGKGWWFTLPTVASGPSIFERIYLTDVTEGEREKWLAGDWDVTTNG